MEINTVAQNATEHLDAHIVNSIYGRRSIENYIAKAESEDRLLKQDEEHSQVRSQVQYKGAFNESSSSITYIRAESGNVNTHFSMDDSSYWESIPEDRELLLNAAAREDANPDVTAWGEEAGTDRDAGTQGQQYAGDHAQKKGSPA